MVGTSLRAFAHPTTGGSDAGRAATAHAIRPPTLPPPPSSLRISAQSDFDVRLFQHRLSSRHVPLVTINSPPQEPLPCQPIGLLTQSLLEKRYYEKSCDLFGSRRKCPSCDSRFRRTAFRRCIVVPESNIQNVRMVCNESGHAGVNVVNAASSSVSTVIYTDMLPAASVISSAAAMGTVAASASTPPASASESAPITTEKTDNSLNTSKAADFSAAFSDANSNRSERVVSRHRTGTPACGAQRAPFFTDEGRLLRAAAPRTRTPRS